MFELYKETIVLNRKNIDVPSLRDHVSGMKDDLATKWCLYIFLLADRTDENPIKDLSKADRELLAATIAFGDEVEQLSDDGVKGKVKNLVADYKFLKVDKNQNDIDLYDAKMEQFMELLEDETPRIVKNTHESSGRVTYTTNIDIITTILENSIKMIIDKSTMVGMKRSGKFIKSLRGGLSPHSTGKVKVIQEEDDDTI